MESSLCVHGEKLAPSLIQGIGDAQNRPKNAPRIVRKRKGCGDSG